MEPLWHDQKLHLESVKTMISVILTMTIYCLNNYFSIHFSLFFIINVIFIQTSDSEFSFRNGKCSTCRVTSQTSISTTGSFFSELWILLWSETSILKFLTSSSYFVAVLFWEIYFCGLKVLKKSYCQIFTIPRYVFACQE